MKKNILIVEDDPFTQKFYSYLLSKRDYEIDVIEDGDKIFELINQKKYSIIIMDVNLKNTYLNDKRIDGIELSRILKQNENFADIPVLIITAYNLSHGSEQFAKSLADDFLVKPIEDYNLLINKVEKLVKSE